MPAWQHNKVLRCLAAETKRLATNSKTHHIQDRVYHIDQISQTCYYQTLFEWAKPTSNLLPPDPRQLQGASNWKMHVNLDQRSIFPPKIAASTLRPDLVLWLKYSHRAFLKELTVSWKDDRGLWMKKALVLIPGGWICNIRLGGWGAASLSGLQRLCHQFYLQASYGHKDQ